MADIFDQVDIFDKVAKLPASVAKVARRRLAERGLTPEAVKSGGGVTQPNEFADTPDAGPSYLGAAARGIGAMVPQLAVTDITQATADGATQAARDAATSGPGRAALAAIPGVGHQLNQITGPAAAAMEGRPPTRTENANAIEGAAAAIPSLAMASPTARGALGATARAVAPDPYDLINRYLGDGAIDTALSKNAGRGIARAKIVAPTAKGIQEGVQSSIEQAQAVKARVLSTPAATTPSIDGHQLIREAFGEPPLNISSATLGRWEEFAGNMAQKVHDLTDGSYKLTPAQADALKSDIDVQFGKLSPDATELNLNAKAAQVRRAIDNAVDRTVPGYKELNDHLADLHHANYVLTEKIAQNSTKPPLSIDPSSLVRNVVANALSQKGARGTRPGVMTTPVRTGLAAALAQSPDYSSVTATPEAQPMNADWINRVLAQYSNRQ